MSLSALFSQWDFSRSINPAFLEHTSSIPQKLHSIIHNLLPLLNAHARTRSALSIILLAAHVKDLSQECSDLFLNRKDWNELKPEMQKTAIAVTQLALSIWSPFLYLTCSATIELWKGLQELNNPLNRIKAASRIFIQCLYLISLSAESPSWKLTLQLIQDHASEKDESEDPDRKEILQHAPFLMHINDVLQGFSILPLIFRNVQTSSLKYPPFISILHYLGCMIQALIKTSVLYKTVLESVSSNHTIIEKIIVPVAFAKVFPVNFVKKDLTNDFIKCFHASVSLGETVFPILEIVASAQELLRTWGTKNYHIGPTGAPVQIDDVVGCDEAKKCVLKIVDQLKNPQKYASIGPVKPIKGILFYGPPGTGKTMLAKTLATAADNAYFLEQAGSSFTEIYVGQGAQHIRQLFNAAHSHARLNPNELVVIFIDEINAIGAPRLTSMDSGQSENNNTTEAFLIEMDRLPPNVVVIGATNTQPKDLDPSFVRAGRFDESIQFKLPNSEERAAILAKLLQKYTVDENIPSTFWNTVARETDEWCYADIDNFIKQAAREAAFSNCPAIDQKIFEKALEKLKKNSKESSSSNLSMYS